jgi:hypothetical protein
LKQSYDKRLQAVQKIVENLRGELQGAFKEHEIAAENVAAPAQSNKAQAVLESLLYPFGAADQEPYPVFSASQLDAVRARTLNLERELTKLSQRSSLLQSEQTRLETLFRSENSRLERELMGKVRLEMRECFTKGLQEEQNMQMPSEKADLIGRRMPSVASEEHMPKAIREDKDDLKMNYYELHGSVWYIEYFIDKPQLRILC